MFIPASFSLTREMKYDYFKYHILNHNRYCRPPVLLSMHSKTIFGGCVLAF